jgi:hypothetical protein
LKKEISFSVPLQISSALSSSSLLFSVYFSLDLSMLYFFSSVYFSLILLLDLEEDNELPEEELEDELELRLLF